MEESSLIWKNGDFIPWKEATTHVLTHALHYGGEVFEGIRFYKTSSGKSCIFRLEDHIKRLFYSASTLEMKIAFSNEEICAAVIELVKRNKIDEGYIRPLIYFGYGKMGLNPTGAPVDIIIALWTWQNYLSEDHVRAKISSFMRIHPSSTNLHAKLGGMYVNSMLASLEVRGKGYDEAIMFDYRGNVAEGPAENIFLVKNGILTTPPPDAILPGITRDSIITIASDEGIRTEQATVSLKDLYNADEAFFTGTAVEVAPIVSVDDKIIGAGKIGEITQRLKRIYSKTIRAELSHHENWLTLI